MMIATLIHSISPVKSSCLANGTFTGVSLFGDTVEIAIEVEKRYGFNVSISGMPFGPDGM